MQLLFVQQHHSSRMHIDILPGRCPADVLAGPQMEAGTKLILVQQPAHFGVQSLPWDDPATLDELRVLTSFRRGNPSQLPPKVRLSIVLCSRSDDTDLMQLQATCRCVHHNRGT